MENREQLLLGVLRWIAESKMKFGTPAKYILAQARCEAWSTLNISDLEAELEYMADSTNPLGKPLIYAPTKLSPAETAWKLTAFGRDTAIERGYIN